MPISACANACSLSAACTAHAASNPQYKGRAGEAGIDAPDLSRSWLVLVLETYRSGQNLIHIDPLSRVVAGVAGGAVAVVLAAVAGFEQAFEG